MFSFKGILKYTLYLFIAAWMFVLGIMVGRGSSPVTFDTSGFQKRLDTIAAQFGRKDTGPKQQIELKFYDVLDQPVTGRPEASGKKKASGQTKVSEITPVEQVQELQENKVSTKKKTFKGTVEIAAETAVSIPEKKTEAVNVQKKTQAKPPAQKPASVSGPEGRYTIQIAAYRDFKDAVTQMADLDKQGVVSYRVKTVKDGVTWYRVRAGSFETLDAAEKYKAQLNQKKINGMIIKKAEQ